MKLIAALLALMSFPAWADPAEFAYGISATGIVTATHFEGDGSRLTGISGGPSPTWADIVGMPARVQAVSNGTPIDLTGLTVGEITGTAIISTASAGIVQAGSVSSSLLNLAGGSTNYTLSPASTALTLKGSAATHHVQMLGSTGGVYFDARSTGTNTTAVFIGNTSSGASITPAATLEVSGTGLFRGNSTFGGTSAPNAPVDVYGLVSATSVGVTGAITASTTGSFGGILTAPTVSLTNAGALLSKSISNSGGLLTSSVSTTGPVSASTAYIGGLVERVVSASSSVSITNLNTAIGGLFYTTLSGVSATVVSLTGGVPGKALQVMVKQPSVGGTSINWSSAHHWNNGLSTTLITSGSTVSTWTWTTPDGSNWYGGLVGSGM